MNPGLAVKLRPTGPWRIGPDSGARDRVDAVYHSDSLYAAVTSAMARLEPLDQWLDATARHGSPAVRFSSCFPFLDEIDFVIPPRTIWPPSSAAVLSPRVRWKSARFVPLGIVQSILSGEALDENHWTVDGESGCLAPAGRPGPFRSSVRSNAAVDRLTGATERHLTACTEFRPGCGLWTIVSFLDEGARERWSDPVKAAFRLLADSGFGGERSRGWGRADAPEFTEGMLPGIILGAKEPPPEPPPAGAHWLLSLFTPGETDSVDWDRGNYTLLARGGRVDSSGELKKQLRMVAEGSVVYAAAPPCGTAPDVAPDGFAHPVFRAGFALSVPLPEAS